MIRNVSKSRTVKMELGLWAKTFQVARRNLPAVAAYIGFMMFLTALSDFMSSSSASGIAQAIAAAVLAVPAHLSILKNTDGLSAWINIANNKATQRFIWCGIGLGIISFTAAFIPTIGAKMAGASEGVNIVVFLLAVLLFSSLIFGRWGTMLPASIISTDYSWKAAGERGKLTLRYTFPRLLLAFGLLTAIQLTFAIGLSSFVNPEGKFFLPGGGIDAAMIFITLGASAIGAIQVVMTAVILSRSYLKAEAITAATSAA